MEFASAVVSRSGKQLLTVGVEPKWEVVSYNLKSQHARAWMPERSAFGPSTSRDGRWIAYVEVRGKETILWRSKPDGSDRLQLKRTAFVRGRCSVVSRRQTDRFYGKDAGQTVEYLRGSGGRWCTTSFAKRRAKRGRSRVVRRWKFAHVRASS